MKCAQCGKDLCERGYCHNELCVTYDDEWWCDCEEDDYEDPLAHVCQGCGSDLCICGECHTPACEAESFECGVVVVDLMG